MMPLTLNRLEPLVVLSCLQKAIRRADERLAMQCAVELAETSKTYATMTLNRLRIILHEDIDVISRPELIAAVETTLQQAAAFRENTNRMPEVRMLIGTVIRLLARAPKSREGDHFHIAVGCPVVNGIPPVIPDWAYDKHTGQGRRLGRGLEHFRQVATRLVPPPAGKDPYEDEAYAIWAAEERGARADRDNEPELFP